MARKLSALSGALTVAITAAALLVPGAGVASASSAAPTSLFVLTPGTSIPSSVPCGTIAEFMAPHGFQFPVQEGGSIVAALRLPGEQAPSFLAQLKLLGTFFSTLTIPAPSCGSGGPVAQ